jgi:hypothetical protein
MGQLRLKEPKTPISLWLFNESPRENIFTIKTVGAKFFKPPTKGNIRSLGTRLPVGMRRS